MKNLSHIQKKFQNYLLHADTKFQNLVVDAGKISVETRLNIYSNAYQSRLIEALMSNYPVLFAYLGEESFEKLSQDYIQIFPSCFPSIRWYGDKLSEFLTNQIEYKSLSYLSELAEFEWIDTLVFDAADSSVLQIEDVATINPEIWSDMRFTLHPSLHRVKFFWNVVEIWQAILHETTLPELVKNSQHKTWAIWRNNLINQFTSLSESEAWAIDAASKGLTFGDICEGLCQWTSEENAGIEAASLLKNWITLGWLANVEF